MKEDAKSITRQCEAFQKHRNFIHPPTTELHSIMYPWLFTQWFLDIVSPLPKARGSIKFFLVATNYFNKWVEAKPLEHITTGTCRKSYGKTLYVDLAFPI